MTLASGVRRILIGSVTSLVTMAVLTTAMLPLRPYLTIATTARPSLTTCDHRWRR